MIKKTGVKKDSLTIVVIIIVCLCLLSCSAKETRIKAEPVLHKKRSLALMGSAIQAGAFIRVENAVRLTERLKDLGLDATYFKADDGLFKVRFGNFASKELARLKAEDLRNAGVIQEYYIVLPENLAAAKQNQNGTDYLREELVKTARNFIGVPYLWGGTSGATGFDCSGLAMTVYQLNGLNLPRHSAGQYETGDDIEKRSLQKGDLVFFSLRNPGKVSHVGIYIGEGQFIHAPSRGRKIRIDSLSSKYYASGYVGARNYL
jgi:hypothetical protein